MALVAQKSCDICGGKAAVLTSKRLRSGLVCGGCAKKASRYADIRKFTPAEMRAHLESRKRNQKELACFKPDFTGYFGESIFGQSRKLRGISWIYVDSHMRKWILSRREDWLRENPDLFEFSGFVGCKAKAKLEKGEWVDEDDEDEISCSVYHEHYTLFLETKGLVCPEKMKFERTDSSELGSYDTLAAQLNKIFSEKTDNNNAFMARLNKLFKK